jgi:hypothetical protein
MTVDAFTALSLVAGIVQFGGFSTRTASKIVELYSIASGFTENPKEILEVAEWSETLAERLSNVSLINKIDTSVIVDHASFFMLSYYLVRVEHVNSWL